MRHTKHFLIVLLAALLLVPAACGSTRGGAGGPAGARAAADLEAPDGLVILDQRLGSEGGTWFLEVVLANQGSGRVALKCAPEWYDPKGALLASASAWRDLQLAAGEQRLLRFSPAPGGSRSWRLRFRA